MAWQDYLNGLAPIELPRPHVSEVKHTDALARVRDAAWRPWEDEPDLEELRVRLTNWFRVPGGTRELKPMQAATLRACFDCRGAFGNLRTGAGKTDISLLIPEVMQAERALLLVPASVREKTKRNAAELSKHYRMRPLRIYSYHELSLAKSADVLVQWQPDLLILDEAHLVKDSGGARWKRIRRYDKWCEKQGRPEVPMLAMSGSFTSRSGREYWHIIRRCLGSSAPVPSDPLEASCWWLALDEKVPDAARLEPGALLGLAPPHPDDGEEPLEKARNRFGRRMAATQGVVGSGGDMPPCGLEISIEHLPPTPPIRAAVDHLRNTWETPCGLPFETAMDLWRHERELSCGLYYRWKTQPPPEWLAARKAWSMFVRDVLGRSRTYDTPLQVSKAVHEGSLDAGDLLSKWNSVSESFRPDTEAVWICQSTLEHAAAWLEKERGICWVHHGAFGDALEQLTGVPYFRQQGQNKAGIAIDQHDGPAIASIQSCATGFDLQGTKTTRAAHWTNVVITAPTKNAGNEQMISRTHRDGQKQDTVYFKYLQRLEGDVKALEQSRADAIMVEATQRAPQRLTVATWI